MDPLKKSLIQHRSDYADNDDEFIHWLDQFAKLEGNVVYALAINLFTELIFTDSEAREFWQAILRHRDSLSATLDRKVHLITAISDYFISIKKSFCNPKVIEIQLYEDTHFFSKCDPLTGLFNRSYFMEAVESEISRSRRQNFEFSLLFMDLDHFKKINDTLGHLAGDRVLTHMAEMIHSEKRAEDIAARYGGDEFVIMLPGTNKINALVKAERFRRIMESKVFDLDGQEFSVTISGGIASFPLDAQKPSDLLKCADKALYRAKMGGKNHIFLYSNEKRQFLRVDFAGPVKARKLTAGEDTGSVPGSSKDLSPAGMLFESKDPLEMGGRVQVQIPIPSEDTPLLVIGTVVRVEEFDDSYDIGISFVQIETRDKDEINLFFKSQLNPDPFLNFTER